MNDPTGVHQSHCCFKHGCKYGHPDCPVANGVVTQDYPCEDCGPDTVSRYYQSIPEDSKEHWLGFKETDSERSGYVKWDGCVGLKIDDYNLHICDLDHWIARLQEIQTMAKRHFGEEWPI